VPGADKRALKERIDKSLACVLNNISSGWKANYKPDGMSGRIEIQDSASNRVIIETELSKSKSDISDDQRGDLAEGVISAIIKVRLPKQLADLGKSDLRKKISKSGCFERVTWCPDRYPSNGWVSGSVLDIALTAQVALNTGHDEYLAPLHRCMDVMEKVANNLDSDAKCQIAKILNQPEGTQTWKMAGLIMSNAMVFYDLISDRITLNDNRKCKGLDELRDGGAITQDRLKTAWRDILSYNYNPIFSVALDTLSTLDDEESETIIGALDEAAATIRSKKVTGSSDMYGKLLQRVITDRVHLASYYTRPEAAALIAVLAVPPSNSPLYKDADAIKKYRVADFACGTGLLLSSAYRQIIFDYEASNPGARKISADVLHRPMMEKCLIGLDVLPIATHLAVSALAMTFPLQVFERTNVKTMPIGNDYAYRRKRRKIKHYRLGSLDLISSDENAILIPEIEVASGKSDSIGGEKPWSIDECHHRIGDGSCDLIVMNPPFVRSTNHAGEHQGRVPAWAAFGASTDEQAEMGRLAAEKFRGTCAHGNAGMGSYFLAVADKKISMDGTLALVLPATISQGESWKNARDMLRNYDVTVISIARMRIDINERSFSSDTGMAEVILVARKQQSTDNPRGRFVSLYERPRSVLEAVHVGNAVNRISDVDRLETGDGGTALHVGDVRVGSAIDCPLDRGWRFVNVVDPVVEQHAYALAYETSRVCKNPCSIHMTKLDEITEMGPHTLDITGNGERGPFTKSKKDADSKYITLWNNVQKQQTKMIVPPDARLIPKPDADSDHVARVWATASRVHININPDVTANSLIAAYTERATVGGRSWPSLSMNSRIEKPFVAWCNSIFGILVFWSFGGKQQLGRILTSRTAVTGLAVPDFGKMDRKTLAALGRVFDEHSDRKLDRIKNLWRDKVRMGVDAKIAKMLGIGLDLDDLRLRLCMEPSVSGGDPEDALVKEYETRVTG